MHNILYCMAAEGVWYMDVTKALCVKVCQLFAVGRCFSPGAPVSSTSETDISSSWCVGGGVCLLEP